jgi:hypothetical protein
MYNRLNMAPDMRIQLSTLKPDIKIISEERKENDSLH